MLEDRRSIPAQVERLSEQNDGVLYDSVARTVRMPYRLDATYDGCWLVEDFRLRIVLPDGYPHAVPSVYEESNAIPEEFSHRYIDGSLCVGVPGEILMDFPDGIDLAGFIDGPVRSCLFSAVFFCRYGRYPFGERSHGSDGILEYYCERFGVESELAAVKLMKLSVSGGYRGSDQCPCGSGRQIWKCHGAILDELSSGDSRLAVEEDYTRVIQEWEIAEGRRQLRLAVRRNLFSAWGWTT